MKLALVGNPNCGKSSIFNQLTGLNQKVSNFPGVTVDKKKGEFKTLKGEVIEVIDLPGTYSIFPTSHDEKVVTNILSNPQHKDFPDSIIYVTDITKLDKQLLLFTQILELKLPTVLVLNMIDLAEKENIKYDYTKIENYFGVKVIPISSKYSKNIEDLKLEIDSLIQSNSNPTKSFYQLSTKDQLLIDEFSQNLNSENKYIQFVKLNLSDNLITDENLKKKISIRKKELNYSAIKSQIDDTNIRYDSFERCIKESKLFEKTYTHRITEKFDKILTHPVLGPLIFIILMIILFQSIFTIAEYPKSWIDLTISTLNGFLSNQLPDNWIKSLIIDGIISGIGGIIVFVPQIAILFLFLTILEESGYMARVVFMFDQIMQLFGLNGRSMVTFISSGACAIPAIMSTRTIENKKERLLTILVSPFISCSARIPVYTVLVSFIVPDDMYYYGLNAQGLVFAGLYFTGIFITMFSAFILKFFIKSSEQSMLVLELPNYKFPLIKTILLTLKEKVWSFVWNAGKIIFVISLILWGLTNFGPVDDMKRAEVVTFADSTLDKESIIASQKLEASFAGQAGKILEPVIAPLGFDWKIGIAIISSFAAREVFVGTMATIYSVGNVDDEATLKSKMQAELKSDGSPRYDLATSLSLVLFFVLAMQCMSTFAIVRKETNSWKWPIFQFLFMGITAYLVSFIVYQTLK